MLYVVTVATLALLAGLTFVVLQTLRTIERLQHQVNALDAEVRVLLAPDADRRTP